MSAANDLLTNYQHFIESLTLVTGTAGVFDVTVDGADLTSDGDRHWCTATAAPCTGLFKPVAVDEPLDLGPDPTDRFDAHCLWWRHELIHRRVLTDAGRLLPLKSARESCSLIVGRRQSLCPPSTRPSA